MLAPSVQITLSKKKELIKAVKAGVQPKERNAIARRFLSDNGISGETVVVEVLDKSRAVTRTLTGEEDVHKWRCACVVLVFLECTACIRLVQGFQGSACCPW